MPRSFLLLCAIAALVPFVPGTAPRETAMIAPPEWPERFGADLLVEIPLSEKDRTFSAGFPGSIQTFRAGNATLILRQVVRPTRKLHSSSDCFRGLGYQIHPEPILIRPDGTRWGQFTASRDGTILEITERITGPGTEAWTDVSAWFWQTTLHHSKGPWLAYTVIRPQ